MRDTLQHPHRDDATTHDSDDSAPTPERQAELQAASAANVAAGKPPYAGVRLVSRGELTWVLHAQDWSGDYDAYTVKYVLAPRGQMPTPADLRGVNLSHVVLRDVMLRRADLSGANLVFADLQGAHLADARLVGADLGRVNLRASELNYADLSQAHLREANLRGANLQYANLSGTRLHSADLVGTVLHGTQMGPATVLSEARLDQGTWLGDISWDGVSLARIDWDPVPRLGDEAALAHATTASARLAAARAVARAYQQLALTLRSQGLSDLADRYAYRAQVWQRGVFWRQRRLGRWLFSWLLALLAGYGYRLQRILLAYLLLVGLFAAAFLATAVAAGQAAWTIPQAVDALQISLNAIHGRVFFVQFHLDTLQSWLATAESICGILIEGVFTAMLVQRFFAR